MAKWQRTDHKLKANHGWKCAPGHKLIVISRGLMQFEYPMHWIVIPGDTSLKIHEKTPPLDDIVLEVSVIPMPPADWKNFSMLTLLQDSLLKNTQTLLTEEEVHKIERPDLQVYWGEYEKIEEDPKDKTLRVAVWRHAFCRSENTFALITYGFWIEAREKADKAWEPLLNSIIMNRMVDDPTRGPVFH